MDLLHSADKSADAIILAERYKIQAIIEKRYNNLNNDGY